MQGGTWVHILPHALAKAAQLQEAATFSSALVARHCGEKATKRSSQGLQLWTRVSHVVDVLGGEAAVRFQRPQIAPLGGLAKDPAGRLGRADKGSELSQH